MAVALAVAPWQAAQAVNFALAQLGRTESLGLPRGSARTGDVLDVVGAATAAAICGITPWRPLLIVSLSGRPPPYNQSASARFGKPLLPRASEPWHCEQLS